MHLARTAAALVFSFSITAFVLAGCSGSTREAAPSGAGVPCAFGSQCESGVCSADVPSGGCGICLDVRPLGERCDGPLQGCSDSARCLGGVCQSRKKILGAACALGPLREDMGECDDDLYCARTAETDGGTCAARLSPGSACAVHDVPCARGEVCERDRCVVARPAALGESCHARACDQGLFCDSSESRVCRRPTLPLGASCGVVDGSFVDDDCSPGSVCGNLDFPDGGGGPGTRSTCVPLPGEEEKCVGRRCAEGLFCGEQDPSSTGIVPPRCERLRLEGEACSTDYTFHVDCAPEFECRKAVCAPACR